MPRFIVLIQWSPAHMLPPSESLEMWAGCLALRGRQWVSCFLRLHKYPARRWGGINFSHFKKRQHEFCPGLSCLPVLGVFKMHMLDYGYACVARIAQYLLAEIRKNARDAAVAVSKFSMGRVPKKKRFLRSAFLPNHLPFYLLKGITSVFRPAFIAP